MENDKNLYQQIRKGDKKSFEVLFKAYYAPLCVFARKYIYDPDESEEVVQAFFLKFWDDRGKIEITTSVKSYLFSSVRNRCLNYIKHQKIRQDYQSDVMNNADLENHSSNYFMEIDLMQKINDSIDSLPKRRREIFILSREHGLKYREIADQMGISIKTVEAQMGQALKDLRDKLKDYQQLLISFFFCKGFNPIRVSNESIVNKLKAKK